MYYKSTEELPKEVKQEVAEEYHELYKDVFNHAYGDYSDVESRSDKSSSIEAAHKIAREAVRKDDPSRRVG